MLAAHPDPGARALLDRFEHHLNDQPWAVYEVKRAFRAEDGNPVNAGNAAHSLARLAIVRRKSGAGR
ncbi:hypothetical protein GCM10010466_66640 [Planomonospora alba]|uniref:Uncharacterized protein n=1 Tax=Planomonospora alba TaxID=161354 RepID=A0ABP6P3Z9_9ACTN